MAGVNAKKWAFKSINRSAKTICRTSLKNIEEKTDKGTRKGRQRVISKYATVERTVHTVSELNRMNRSLNGKESLPVMCHPGAALPLIKEMNI
jgi:hypothetical protein